MTMPVMMTDTLPRNMDPVALYDSLVTGLEDKQPEDSWRKIFKFKKTTKPKIVLDENTGLGPLQETTEFGDLHGDRFYAGYKKEIFPRPFNKGVQASREEWDDDQRKTIHKYAEYMTMSKIDTMSTYATSVLNNAFTTACKDGQYLISNSHPYEGPEGGTWSNLVTGNPKLTIAALEQGLIQFKYCANGRGLSIVMKPRFLVVGTALEYTAKKMLIKGNMPFTNDNTKNLVADEGLEVVVLPKLTSSTAWFLMQAVPQGDNLKHPLIHLSRIEFETEMDRIFDKSNAPKCRAYMRQEWDTNTPRGIVGSTGA